MTPKFENLVRERNRTETLAKEAQSNLAKARSMCGHRWEAKVYDHVLLGPIYDGHMCLICGLEEFR